LENIDRMVVGAANAFLKTAEEPLSSRLLIATASNELAVLETIRSRALLIRFGLPEFSEIEHQIALLYPDLSLRLSPLSKEHLRSLSAARV
jgi:DNA polymerase III subunit delta'